MEFLKFKEALFEKAKNQGFQECEVYFTNRKRISISVYEQEVENYSLTKDLGLSFRGEIDGKIGYSFTEVLDEQVIDLLLRDAKESINVLESNDIQFIYGGDKEYKDVNSYSKELEGINSEKLINIAVSIEREAREYSDKVENIEMCSISYGNVNLSICNTKGLELKNKINFLSMYVVPVVNIDGKQYEGMGYLIAHSLNDVNPKKIAEQGVEEALSKVGARSIPTGRYKTVIYNEAMMSLLSIFSTAFNADFSEKGLSVLKGKEGEIIASQLVTIIDDPHLINGIASTSFDDEGVATYKKELVYNGRLITLLHNLETAYKKGIKSTGNGFKSNQFSKIGIASTNLYIDKGDKTIEELIKNVDDGILITEFSGIQSGTNSVTGDFSLSSKGFYIKNGKKSYPVEQIIVTGNFFELLKNIECIGNDLKFPMSNVGSPSVIVKEISISGKI